MYLIAGLGNPGREYRDTRHNAGFMVVDEISRITGIKVRGFRYRGRTGKGKYKGDEIYLIKPRTFMNNSGEAVKAAMRGLRVKPDKLIVVYDDLDLPAGAVRVRKKGGPGGHKGVQSIIDRIGTTEFPRVRIGIGRPKRSDGRDSVDYVLSPFDDDEMPAIKEAMETGAHAVLAVVAQGIDRSMNQFNSK